MNNKILLFLLMLSFLSYGQIEKLNGSWILDKINYKNGSPLEINHNLYSVYIKYEFNDYKLITDDGTHFDFVITNTQIKNKFRIINYKFEEDNLILNDEEDNITLSFLRKENFIKKYPEFEPIETTYDDQKVFIPNEIYQPNFKHDSSLFHYIIEKTPILLSSDESFDFLLKFILTKENKIKNINILNNNSNIFEEQIKLNVLKSENLFKNKTGRNLLIEKRFLINKDKSKEKENKKYYKLYREATEFYNKNDFKNAIITYTSVVDYNLKNNSIEYDTNLSLIYRNLGVSYLFENEKDKACECFKKVGDKTNFIVRNYLINFCE
jgi:hypothetical protein